MAGKKQGFSAVVKFPKSANLDYMEIIGKMKEHTRSAPKVKEYKDTITVEIEAKDLASLRAAFNTIARDVQVVENTEAAVKLNLT